ncbi:MAG: hypothetical protein NVSMB65_00510 [Chloroflexota bacterium]
MTSQSRGETRDARFAARRDVSPLPSPLVHRSFVTRVTPLLERVLPDDDPTQLGRVALYSAGLACFGGVQMLGPYLRAGLNRHYGIMAMFVFLIAGLAFYYLACRRTVPRLVRDFPGHGRALAVIGLLGALWLSVYGVGEIVQFPRDLSHRHHYQNDAVTNTYCATQMLLHGQNPYTGFSMVDCLVRNGLNGRFTTPLQAGAFAHIRVYPSATELQRAFERAARDRVRRPKEFETSVSYPAGAFILPLPFVALGWHEMSTFYLAWILLSYVLLLAGMPARWRGWLLALALGNIALWGDAVSGSSDALDIFLILAAWMSWRRPWLSPLLMGAAIATRQQGWFFAVFYAILVGRAYGMRALIGRLATMGAVFAAVNLPFFFAAPGAWINGSFGPLKDRMFPLGAGLVALAVHAWLPLWPHDIYTVLELLAMVACAVVYARTCRLHPGTGLVLALVPLVFAWRSLFTYFAPLSILCLWPVFADRACASEPREAEARAPVVEMKRIRSFGRGA